MQTAITGQTTLDNGKKVFRVVTTDGKQETREDYIYSNVTSLLRRIRRDKATLEFQQQWRS